MASILTNSSAMTALKVLNQTNKALEQTQARISTGLKVGSSKDNASFWAVSTIMKSDVSTFKAISDNLSLANNATSVARDGAQQITKLIDEIKTKTTAAQEGSLDKAKIQADIDAALGQIGEIVKTAQFNGVNLLGSDENVRLLSSVGRSGSGVDASYINFNAQNLSLDSKGGLAGLSGISVLDRGEGLFKNKSDGKIVTTIDFGANLDGSAKKGDTGETVTFTYKDAKGIARTVGIQLTQDINTLVAGGTGSANMAKLLSENAELSKVFDFEAVGTELKISSKNRENVAEFTGLSIADGSQIGAAGGAVKTDVTKLASNVDFTFKDAPLRLGEKFEFEFVAKGDPTTNLNFKLSFTVVGGDTPAGRVLSSSGAGTAADPYTVNLALDARQVAYEHVTGAQIAAHFNSALTAFEATAAATGPEKQMIAAVAANPAGTVDTINYSVSGATLSIKNAASDTNSLKKVTVPQTDYQALLDTIESAMQVAVGAAAAFGSAQKRVDIQQDFLKTLVNNLETGIGTLVDADMNEESARLQALQVQQQLGIQALSIANQAPQSLLSLFR
ncbi:flagellin [Caenispirillum bisanense]|uniref:flagellin N-terminal helical domain-containing protein n=1 Tax=Caenispirillum bisanense TaxID=414052 RepID=UPI0031E24F45